MLRAEADMPLDELLSKYEGLVGLHAMSKKAKKEKMCSPMIKSKCPTFPSEGEPESPDSSQACSSSVGSCSMVCELDAKLANGLADNENNLNAEKEMNESCQNRNKNSIETGSEPSQSDCKSNNSSSSHTEHKSDSNSEPTVSSSVSETGEAVSSKPTVSAAEDGSSKEACSSTSVQSSSVSKSDSILDEPGPSCSGSCSVTTSGQSSSTDPQPSGSRSCAADEPGPSGSSDEVLALHI